jgi:hypothetical protein
MALQSVVEQLKKPARHCLREFGAREKKIAHSWCRANACVQQHSSCDASTQRINGRFFLKISLLVATATHWARHLHSD